jgi:hypothetical protein
VKKAQPYTAGLSFRLERRLLGRPNSPAPDRYASPYRLDDTERPRALQEAVNRSKGACPSEGQSEPRAAILQCIEDQHRRDGEQAE